MVPAYPVKGNASVNTITDVFSGNFCPRNATQADLSAVSGAAAERLDPERLPLAATSSETATQVPRTWLYTVR
jgi:hypothetical protein